MKRLVYNGNARKEYEEGVNGWRNILEFWMWIRMFRMWWVC